MTTTTEAPDLVERVAELQLAAFLAGRGSIRTKADGRTVEALPGPTMDDYRRMALAAIPSQAGEVERLRKRLEVVEGWSEDADGIACRDATIKLLDDKCETLRAQLAAKDQEIARLRAEIEGMKIELYGVPAPTNAKHVSISDLHKDAALKGPSDVG